MGFRTDNLQVDGSLITQQIYRADISVAAITIDSSNNVIFANDIYATNSSLNDQQLVIGDFLTQDQNSVVLGGDSSTAAKLSFKYNPYEFSFGFGATVNEFDGIYWLGVKFDSSGKIYVGGDFTTLYSDGLPTTQLIRLNSDGTRDNTFDISSGFSVKNPSDDSYYITPFLDSSGHIYVGGSYTFFRGLSQNYLIRLNSDGTKDTTFDISSGFNGYVDAFALDSSGRIYVGGNFTTYRGLPQKRLVRLNSDGTKDATFDVSNGFNHEVYDIILDANGKIYVAGAFNTYQDVSARSLIRLNSDGTRDNTFDISFGFNFAVYNIALDTINNKLYAGGYFTEFNGSSQNGLIRLNLDGTKDSTFDIGTGFYEDTFGAFINNILIDNSNNKVYAGGWFINYQDASVVGVVKLNFDGSQDENFVAPFITDYNGFTSYTDIYTLDLDANKNNLYVGGVILGQPNASQNTFVKLNANTGDYIVEYNDTTDISIDEYGLSYAADYSSINANNDRWIPDKAYVDTKISGVNAQDTSIISYIDSKPLPDVSKGYVDIQDASIFDYADNRMDGIDLAITYLDMSIGDKADLSYVDAAIDYLEASIGLKAPVESPTFNTSFALGLWKFSLDGSNLVLSFNDVSAFTFTPDGSII